MFVEICTRQVRVVADCRKVVEVEEAVAWHQLRGQSRLFLGSSCYRTCISSFFQLARSARVAASSLLEQVARVCLVLAGKRALASFTVRDWVVARCRVQKSGVKIEVAAA